LADKVLNEARRQFEKALIDLRDIGHATNQDPYTIRRYKEIINSSNGSPAALRATLAQLKRDFDYLVVATANSAAVRRRDSLATLLETL